jgi:phospholipid/cholesterol/gamma-HCH transport system substrate-binding protein
MPQRRQVTWAQLRVGALVIASLVVLAIGIFFISGEVGFLSRKYSLKAYFSTASGLRPGSQVRIAGIPVGAVDQIRISDFIEPERAVEVTLRVPHSYREEIRANSEASLETAGLLGETYVNITRGNPEEPVVPEQGVLKSSEEADVKRIMANTNDVITNLRTLSARLNNITEQIEKGEGTVGKLLYDPGLYNRLNDTVASVNRVVNRVESGEGTVGKLLKDETLYERTTASINRLDQILDEVQHGQGSLAKFINDPGVYNNVNRLVTRADTMVENINQGQGTLGKLATDPTLYNRLNDTLQNINVITDRIERGEGTLGKLSTDPTMFNNLSASADSLKEFLTEFRKNPKKYLTVKLRLFW